MKKLFSGVAALLIFTSWSATTYLPIHPYVAVVSSCSTVQTNRLSDPVTEAEKVAIGFFSANTNATFFIAASTFTGCKVLYAVAKNGSPTFNLRACILNDNAGVPGTLVEESADVVAASSISTSDPTASTITFTFANHTFTSGTKYWVSLHPDAAGDSNDIFWYCRDGFVSGAVEAYSGGWSEANNRLAKFEMLGP